jgi:citrate synthase
MLIYDKIDAQLPAWRDRVSRLLKTNGSYKVCDVTVEQIYRGIRDVQIQVSDISYLEPYEGIRLRGYTIPEVLEKLPKWDDTDIPLAGGLYYLLLVDEVPTMEQAQFVEDEWKRRGQVPEYVWNVLRAMPANTHPMTLFSQAVLAMQPDSLFAREYSNGILKTDYWKTYLEDSLNLTARLPAIAAFIYNLKYQDGLYISPDPDLDWSANFSHMIGKDNGEYSDLSRLFFVIHSDHEGANVSAHAAHLVCSALSDVYLGCSAGLDGLAGPLHGLANQECLRWLLDVRDHFGGLPSKESLVEYCQKQLSNGGIIPGYGHAVLRTTDPRFTAQLEFGKKYLPNDELFQLVELVYEILPPILGATGKVKNPWPNVDAITGAVQYHYGLTQFDFYTVLFGVSRLLGLTAHAVWSRALGKPIERPKSLTTRMLEEMVG